MKKLLALLFVCAGLTAMAATPHSIKTVNLAKQNVLSKANTLGNELTKPVMNKVLISNAKGSTVSSEVGTVNVTLDANSTWTLTADTYISSFNGEVSNVVTNGYKLYVNGEAII